MKRPYTKPVMYGNLIAAVQPNVNGWKMSYNPDDDRWYVHHPETDETTATFNRRNNAIVFCNSRDPADYVSVAVAVRKAKQH